MRNLNRLKVICCILILSSSIGMAQNAKKPSIDKNFWISSSLGFTTGSQYAGVLADFSIAYSKKSGFYSIEYFGTADIGEVVTSHKKIVKSMRGVNFLYGTINRNDFYKVSYSIGLSVIESFESKREFDLHSEAYKYTVGIPLSTQLVLTPIRIVAIGIKGYININTENSFIGASIGFYFGKVN